MIGIQKTKRITTTAEACITNSQHQSVFFVLPSSISLTRSVYMLCRRRRRCRCFMHFVQPKK